MEEEYLQEGRMGSEEAFCLKWNDVQGSITSTLGSLRAPLSPLQDVTIECGGESLPAHRLVLALCRYRACVQLHLCTSLLYLCQSKLFSPWI